MTHREHGNNNSSRVLALINQRNRVMSKRTKIIFIWKHEISYLVLQWQQSPARHMSVQDPTNHSP